MARLYALFATRAPVAAILRRGPSKWYHVIRWNTADDTFEHGAWIKGRLYEHASDVSPDGTLFVYGLHHGSRIRTAFKDSYTAVSRLPWLQALALWPNGTTYFVGGRFVTARALQLRCDDAPHPDFPPDGLTIISGSALHHRDAREVPDADWSGRDQRDRLLFSRGGRLFVRETTADRMIADFEDLAPDPQPAPEWAGQRLSVSSDFRETSKSRRRKT